MRTFVYIYVYKRIVERFLLMNLGDVTRHLRKIWALLVTGHVRINTLHSLSTYYG